MKVNRDKELEVHNTVRDTHITKMYLTCRFRPSGYRKSNFSTLVSMCSMCDRMFGLSHTHARLILCIKVQSTSLATHFDQIHTCTHKNTPNNSQNTHTHRHSKYTHAHIYTMINTVTHTQNIHRNKRGL